MNNDSLMSQLFEKARAAHSAFWLFILQDVSEETAAIQREGDDRGHN